MRNSTSTLCLLTLACFFAGCSQTAGVRSKPSSSLTTIASVGDKPLPIVAGPPDASLRAETEQLDRPAGTDSRISGRVYDERGKVVPSAKVRLAVGSAAGGKVVSATTDRSGAFTLHGLRPGASYTLIAEYQGEDGLVTGRAQAKAPQTEVRIALQYRGDEYGQGHSSIRPARPRVDPISNVDAAEDEASDEVGAGSRIHSEDLEPPAAEATTLLPGRNLPASRTSSDSAQVPMRPGWNARQTASTAGGGTTAEAPPRDDDADLGSRTRASARAGEDLDDDGPNPLPPALETNAISSPNPGAHSEDQPVRMARSGSRGASRAPRTSADLGLDQGESKIGEPGDESAERTPRTIPAELLPGERVITPGSYGPIVIADPAGPENPPRSPVKRTRRPVSPAGSRPSDSATAAEDSNAKDASDASGSNDRRAARRPTWRELSLREDKVPLDESLQRAAGSSQPGEKGVVTLTSSSRGTRPAVPRFLSGSLPPLDEALKQSVCRIDPNERRLVDFKLPDLGGNLVSLHDIDADVILLDFWGSWCQPCRKSISHLIELQTKLAGKRFQVVGVACEKAAAPADRRASAAKAMQELGINYPVLLSGMDGSCPVQQALQIHFYPTLVLLDRDGRLLAREQGATDATLPRMDRAITAALRSHDNRAEN
jgi:thiol-disulfide isomerase/thioredoxin